VPTASTDAAQNPGGPILTGDPMGAAAAGDSPVHHLDAAGPAAEQAATAADVVRPLAVAAAVPARGAAAADAALYPGPQPGARRLAPDG
jgi:hypothetical protein